MRFTEVKEIPGDRVRRKNEMRDILTEYMNMNIKSVKVEDHGYATTKLAYLAFKRAAERHVFPIDVHMRNGEVYLIRRDM